MSIPFTSEQFFGVFAAYNEAVWPAQIALNALAIVAILLAIRAPAWSGRAITAILAFLWVWMAVAYHWLFFAEINPAARFFGAAFAAEGALLGWLAVRDGGPRFRPRCDLRGVAGAGLVTYALAVYPLLGLLAGHAYPAQPTFGLPCPTTIFTIGMLLWARPGVPWSVLLVPAAWSVIGLTAVRHFGVLEDAALPFAGLLGAALILWRGRGTRGPSIAR